MESNLWCDVIYQSYEMVAEDWIEIESGGVCPHSAVYRM